MLIRFSREQELRLLEWAAAIGQAHVSAECEPPGYNLIVAVTGAFGASARAECGSASIDLGEVNVELDINVQG
jgi:hypothetical protein